MFALVRFVDDRDDKLHVVGVNDIDGFEPKDTKDFDNKAIYSVFWVDKKPGSDDTGFYYKAQVLLLAELEAKITNIHKILPTFQLVYGDAEQLASMISFTSTLAENISSKVRQLDLAKSRATECVQRVEDILDLKFCTDGVQTALQNEDYEQAAAHIHRFLSLDESLLKRSTADIQEGSSLEEAFSSLRAAEKQASCDSDEKHDEGLHKFSLYLSSQISETAHKNLKQAQAASSTDKRGNVIYADTVTLLFEGIARTVEIHQPLVETYYGHGRLHTVVELLQKECDCQVKKILEDFRKNRQFKKKAQQVQMLLRSSKQMDKLDPRDLDVLLAEVALLNSRAELYLRFIRRRVSTTLNNVEMAREYTKTLASSLQEDLSKSFSSATEQETAKLESCLTDLNNSSLKFQSLLSHGVAELCNAAVKPHIKSWADTFQSTDHTLTEDDFTSYEANDGIRPFLQTFIVTLDGALKAFKADLIPANYDSLVNLTAAETTFQLEKALQVFFESGPAPWLRIPYVNCSWGPPV
ncbi:hypothetical protein V5799_030320 [Amblyomma americanum]|uniref:Conserved oligomeric Golgi complex subunit 4 n=1 Tax=Amblyomma americanum TaxID=6943 RepID=A0AAQ4EPA1_AMBAM